MDFLVATLGLVILLMSGDVLVRGAVNMALRLGVPALIVSLSIIAFGTSAPELLIAIEAIWDDAPGIALGNVVGSNTANILLVLGVPALIAGLSTTECETRRSYVHMIAASLLFIVACFLGPIGLIHGIVLLFALALVLGDQVRTAMAHRSSAEPDEDDEDLEGADPEIPWWKIFLFTALGLIGLPLGADLLVESATDIAKTYGISDRVIGLTLVAVGTSLPELATTVMAAIRRQADVALGNVIGSNMFNLLAIIGVASLFGTIPVDTSFLTFDLWVMLAASLVLAPFVFHLTGNMNRLIGVVFTSLYIAYLAVLVAA
ncbi:MAG: calcium/sodium antiporter [Pseudomonadota bacterium]